MDGLFFNQNIKNIMFYFLFVWSGWLFLTKILFSKISKVLLFVVIYCLYITTITIIMGSVVNLQATLLNILFFPILFSLSLMLERKKSLSEITLYLSSFFIIFSAYSYIWNSNDVVESAASINAIYYVVLATPFTLCLDNKLFKYITIVFAFFAILISLKRTALIAIGVAYVVYFIVENKKKIPWNSGRIKLVISSIGFLIFAYYSYGYLKSNMGIDIFSRFATLKEDKGSGRLDVIYLIFEKMKDLEIFKVILGNGYDGVAKQVGLSAHNDFLEILFDYGIIGLSFYIMLWIILLRYFGRMLKHNYEFVAAFGSALSIFLVMSLSSHLIFIPTYSSIIILFFGYAIYDYKQFYSNNILSSEGNL